MLNTIISAMPVYMLVMSAAAFLAMGADKLKARRGSRRIPERTLFLLALIGGAAGGLAGMYAFRHKTRHLSFKIGMPLLLILNLAALYASFTFLRG